VPIEKEATSRAVSVVGRGRGGAGVVGRAQQTGDLFQAGVRQGLRVAQVHLAEATAGTPIRRPVGAAARTALFAHGHAPHNVALSGVEEGVGQTFGDKGSELMKAQLWPQKRLLHRSSSCASALSGWRGRHCARFGAPGG